MSLTGRQHNAGFKDMPVLKVGVSRIECGIDHAQLRLFPHLKNKPGHRQIWPSRELQKSIPPLKQ